MSIQGIAKPHLLIGCSGSVAAVKLPELVVELSEHYDILIIVSSKSLHFIERAKDYDEATWVKFQELGGLKLILTDEDEWHSWNRLGDTVLHIELRKWADIFVVAPASANLIAHAAIGAADNLLLSVMRAWDFAKPCVLCPAMNTLMWDHPATVMGLSRMKQWGWKSLGPIEKLLACNERGNGAMVSVTDIKMYLLDLEVKRSDKAEENPLTEALKTSGTAYYRHIQSERASMTPAFWIMATSVGALVATLAWTLSRSRSR